MHTIRLLPPRTLVEERDTADEEAIDLGACRELRVSLRVLRCMPVRTPDSLGGLSEAALPRHAANGLLPAEILLLQSAGQLGRRQVRAVARAPPKQPRPVLGLQQGR